MHCEQRRKLGPHAYRGIDPALYERLHHLLYPFMGMYARHNKMGAQGYSTKSVTISSISSTSRSSYYAAKFPTED